jgi:hypothetical protein
MKAKTGIYLALAGRMTQILVDIDRIAKRAEFLMSKARSTSDEGYMDGVALCTKEKSEPSEPSCLKFLASEGSSFCQHRRSA